MGAFDLDEGSLRLHFIPYPSPGHMIPLCDIARLFSSRGHHVTILTTPSNAHTLHKFISHRLRLHTVHFPSRQLGLPDGVENLAAVNNVEDSVKVHEAAMLLRGPMERFLERNPPDCIVADFFFPWVHDVATKLRIPRLVFNGFSLFAVCAMHSIYANPIESYSNSDPNVVRDLPHRITLNATPPTVLIDSTKPLLEMELKSHGIIVNNFAELDGEEYIQHYEKTTGHKAWHVGPVSLICRTAEEKTERGQESVVSAHKCLSWLNSKRANSVLYICFGSINQFSDKQLYEIACAVEASGCDFVWVVPEKKGKENESEEEKAKWMPKGFEKRNMTKGMIIRGWAPQVLILGHLSVGAFLTHCGWNSTVEAVSAGVPMIMWPVHDEQFYNEKLISEVHGIGVEVGAEEWNFIGFVVKKKVVGRESIEKAVRKLMDGGDEAEKIRQRARELGKKARAAVEEGGSSHKNLTSLIDELKRLRDSSS
ncbi:hypothetical protein HN51_063694 [Arachis hypogaea]|uniref:UDP-glucose flavonoid 3-O-glucosyltransferase 7-like n=1 Tax=Arachis ipaensis TaxID=130454 RepID=UPI0007AF45A4|nr:UDP-glucose flavonoid 3-O-glucosyltransferase 7-like [Arachis ipaensis]XP_025628784.1 UDP-glucose flavonoid 3-O-glucosyltransferase 7-like [Arachis hypogaea]